MLKWFKAENSELKIITKHSKHFALVNENFTEIGREMTSIYLKYIFIYSETTEMTKNYGRYGRLEYIEIKS